MIMVQVVKAIRWGDWVFPFPSIHHDHIDFALMMVADGVLTREELEEATTNDVFVFGYYYGDEQRFDQSYRSYFKSGRTSDSQYYDP